MAQLGRKPNMEIKAGTVLGELVVLGKVRTPPRSAGGQRFRVECKACGNVLTIPRFYLIRQKNPKRHCGCRTYEDANPYPREKIIWWMMHRRCYHSDHVAYKYYGGAEPPVTVCPRWHRDLPNDEGFKNFVDDMGPAPSKGHSLDRINPFGIYEPSNCRWATKKEQANNKKHHWRSALAKKGKTP